MKIILMSLLVLTAFSVRAEEVNMNVDKIKTEGNESTTITIKKGQPAAPNVKKWETHDGTDDIAGDKAPLRKTAEQNWKKACNEWRAELKATNKENKIISHSCGKMECTKTGVETTCTSKASYKIKSVVEE